MSRMTDPVGLPPHPFTVPTGHPPHLSPDRFERGMCASRRRACLVPGPHVTSDAGDFGRRTQSAAGTGSGRFSIAAAMTSGNRSGVHAKAGAPRAASAAACSRS